MPHDIHGAPLTIGGRVNLPAIVEEVYPGDLFCNIKLRLVHPMPIGEGDGRTEYLSSVNTKMVESVPRRPLTDDPLLQFFEYAHLPPHLQNVSKPFGDLAHWIVATLPRNPERTVALRKLLEAKDCAVRAVLFK